MEGFLQFGTIKRLRLARNKKTGKSKHFGFIEFESPEVAKVVMDIMHNHYLLFGTCCVCLYSPLKHASSQIAERCEPLSKPLDWVKIERKRQDKERTLEEHNKFVEGILKRDKKRRKRIEAAGIDYECPEMVLFRLQSKRRLCSRIRSF
ncbi:MKI67 FHA domain-interacting nucleolar phosphoprotein [Datura stramonium]|uniref:MKI67 FHA domain-interacting nucleolar phosphoprotein n=1 Tax=Datura stramonium TaxID=4076 RepID=A0ABS8VSM3_DATST|nr:MKI67 FHA domain-interacting nucleolar phosphoprotein [Datura stramonium]